MMAAYLHLVGDWESPPGSGFRTVDPARRAREDALEELYKLAEAGKHKPAMNRMYQQFHTLIMASEYAECNARLRDMDVDSLPDGVLLGILTITFHVRSRVPERAEVFRRIAEKLSRTMSTELVAANLRGLEG